MERAAGAQATERVAEILPPHTAVAFAAMHALRGGLAGVDAFVDQVDGTQRAEGYRLAGVVPAGATDAAAVAGFRITTCLSWGRHLYVDDLSTLPEARGRGYAGLLLDWLHDEARRQGCGELHLDSGVIAERYTAHRLYLNAGYAIVAHHFARPV